MPTSDKCIYRVLDANLNRAREGLRVVEEVVRFVWDEPDSTKVIKEVRHGIQKAVNQFLNIDELKQARETQTDVGRNTYTESESEREELKAVVMANMQRTQEALRVLEEFSKVINKAAGRSFKELRYQTYILEKDLLQKLITCTKAHK